MVNDAELSHAALLLAKSVPDALLDEAREAWGNTNVAVVKHWRDAVLATLESPPASDAVDPVAPSVTDGPRAHESSSEIAALQQQVAAIQLFNDNAEIEHQRTLQRMQKAGELLEGLNFWPSPSADSNLARDIGRVLQGKAAERSSGVEETLRDAGIFTHSWKQRAERAEQQVAALTQQLKEERNGQTSTSVRVDSGVRGHVADRADVSGGVSGDVAHCAASLMLPLPRWPVPVHGHSTCAADPMVVSDHEVQNLEAAYLAAMADMNAANSMCLIAPVRRVSAYLLAVMDVSNSAHDHKATCEHNCNVSISGLRRAAQMLAALVNDNERDEAERIVNAMPRF